MIYALIHFDTHICMPTIHNYLLSRFEIQKSTNSSLKMKKNLTRSKKVNNIEKKSSKSSKKPKETIIVAKHYFTRNKQVKRSMNDSIESAPINSFPTPTTSLNENINENGALAQNDEETHDGMSENSRGDEVDTLEIETGERSEDMQDSNQLSLQQAQYTLIQPPSSSQITQSLSVETNQTYSNNLNPSRTIDTKESLLRKRLENMGDDYSFLNQVSDMISHHHVDVIRKKMLDLLFSTSRMAWIMRKEVFISNNSRESAREQLFDIFRKHALEYNFNNVPINIEQKVNYITYVETLFGEGGLTFKEITRKQSNFDKRIRRHVKGWMSILEIDLIEMKQCKNKMWLFNLNHQQVEKISPLFQGIEEQGINSIFPLIVCLVAFKTSPTTAIMDLWCIFVLIWKLLNGHCVSKQIFLECITKKYSALVAGLMLSYSNNKYLQRGPSFANPTSGCVLGKATAIMKEWDQEGRNIPSILHPIVNIELKAIIFNTLAAKVVQRKKNNISTYPSTSLIDEECYPNMDNFIL